MPRTNKPDLQTLNHKLSESASSNDKSEAVMTAHVKLWSVQILFMFLKQSINFTNNCRVIPEYSPLFIEPSDFVFVHN